MEAQFEEESLGEMKQVKISLPEGVINFFKAKQVAKGYSAYSHIIADALIEQYEIEKEETEGFSEIMEKYRQYNKIGDSASKMRGRKFAIANSINDLNETIKGYDDNPWLKQADRQNLKKEAIIEHVINTRRELLKQNPNITKNKFKKKSNKSLKRKLEKIKAWYDEQYIPSGEYKPTKPIDKKLVLQCDIELELERRALKKRTNI